MQNIIITGHKICFIDMNIPPYALIILFSLPVLISYADTETDELFQKGTEAFQNFRFSEAISYYDKILEINPKHEDALSNKGAVLFQLGKHDEAISYLDKVLEINPNHIGALNNKGAVLVELGKAEEAIPYLDKVLEINPNDLYALTYKGDAFFQLHDTEEALSYYKSVVKIEPDYDLKRIKIVGQKKTHNLVEGTLEIIVHNSKGQLVTYQFSDKFYVINHKLGEAEIDNWNLKETITRDGKQYDVLQMIAQQTLEEDKFPGATGFAATLERVNSDTELKSTKKIWFVQVFHNVTPLKIGDTATNIYTLIRPK